MQISSPPRSRDDANLLPMINVVFLLLIFFLISAQLAPPEPFAVTPPDARSEDAAEGELSLFLGADGVLGFRDLTSQDADADGSVIAALTAAREEMCEDPDCAPHLLLHADAQAPVDRLAAVLPKLAKAGFSASDLIVRSAG